jgi:hypothetical protein
MRFTESVNIRLWGRELHKFRRNEIHDVAIAVAGVLIAQGCAVPVVEPPSVPCKAAA